MGDIVVEEDWHTQDVEGSVDLLNLETAGQLIIHNSKVVRAWNLDPIAIDHEV